MPRLFSFCCGKESVSVVDVGANENQQTLSSQRSVSVPDAPAVTNNIDKGTPWWYRLFGHLKKKNQSVVTTQNDTKPNTKSKKAKKPRFWRCCKTTHHVSPVPKGQRPSTLHQDMVTEFTGLTKEEERLLGLDRDVVFPAKTRLQQIRCLGFPNPAQICYMNSCLQSLLTLEDFVRAISSQEQVWRSLPKAELVRSFMNIKCSHRSSNAKHKIRLLDAFKRAIWSPEFRDRSQKDAHEFLTCVLEQMRCLRPQLQTVAAGMGQSYCCPVEEHMVFKMANTRTCKSCCAGSTREEEFTNLSLDLVPGGGSVEQMLQNYLMETELEYNCECGATTSSQRSSFVTLPRVLVLHLKRFRYTPSFQLTKVHDPVTLLRDLVVSSNQDGACFSLVSIINHIGSTAGSGHYICDGVDPDVGQEDPTDRWFTYNDAQVTETSGDFVCNLREKTSYILFYQRHD